MTARRTESLGDGAVLHAGFVGADERAALADGIRAVAATAPFRRFETRGGRRVAVAMTNCGPLGWVSDRFGYRYDPLDPSTARPWPPMPPGFASLAARAAAETGFAPFAPDACLVNRYGDGVGMGLHQDRDEHGLDAPIVSVSLGREATFLWGGLRRDDPVRRLRLADGDVVVWGGPSRLAFHGVAPLGRAAALLGEPALRFNLTFRRAGRPAGSGQRTR